MADQDIPFDRSLPAKPGETAQLSPLVRRLIAGNGGPFTFTGTCSYLVGREEIVVIDPGPADGRHRDDLLRAIGGSRVKAILVTHTHRDHAPGAPALRAATGAPILGPPPTAPPDGANWVDGRALDAAHDRTYGPDRVLVEGDTISADGFSLEAVETPGHSAHHLSFALPGEAALFSGDHVMAWSTTVVAPPDGSMRAYMASLEKLLGRAETVYWPGHGGPVLNPPRFVRALLHHRRQREHAILARLRAGEPTVAGIVAAIYENLAPALRGAAALSVLAHLEDLEQRGLVSAEGQGLSALYRIEGQGQFSAA
jgi:glyoxylase-like metal-dependent hydrolase (beta-lactamase superfamily II)